MTMEPTERSIDATEKENALTLRSRGVDVVTGSEAAVKKDRNVEDSTRTKGGDIIDRSKPLENPNDRRTETSGDDIVLMKTPSSRDTDADEGERGSSPTGGGDAAVVRSAPPPPTEEGHAIGDKNTQQLDAAAPTYDGDATAAVTDVGAHGPHKRSRSEEYVPAVNNHLDMAVSLTGDNTKTNNGQRDARALPNDGSSDDDDDDDDDVPETFGTNLKQSLPFKPASKEPKSKKPKPKSFKTPHRDDENSASTSADQVIALDGDDDKQPSVAAAEMVATPKPRRAADGPAPKRAKTLTRNGVTFCTLSDEGEQGQTSPWLPAKASLESRKRKEGLLVRRRVQEVCSGQRQKFIVGKPRFKN